MKYFGGGRKALGCVRSVLALLLAVLMCVSMLPVSVLAAEIDQTPDDTVQSAEDLWSNDDDSANAAHFILAVPEAQSTQNATAEDAGMAGSTSDGVQGGYGVMSLSTTDDIKSGYQDFDLSSEPGMLCISKWIASGLDQRSVGMVYYEVYDNDGYVGIDGFLPVRTDDGKYVCDCASTLRYDGDADHVVKKDGYALVIPADDSYWADSTVTYGTGGAKWWPYGKYDEGRETWYGKSEPTSWKLNTLSEIEISGLETRYRVVCLPDTVMTGNLADKDHFWQKVTCGKGDGAATFYFNPHFAKTVRAMDMPPAELTNEKWDAISVRTPRHLYSLSRFQDAGSLIYATRGYYFWQQLDLDYDSYVWYGSVSSPAEGTVFGQDPIGQSDQSSFTGTYDGGGHTIRNVLYNTDKGNYIGLFGYATGLLTRIDYLGDYGETGQRVTKSGGTVNMGLLAGYAAVITDCTVIVNGQQTLENVNGGVYGGGMAGYATRMEGCTATVNGGLSVKGNGSNIYGGGLAASVGSMTGCTSTVNGDLTVMATGDAFITYGGGLVGFVNDSYIAIENCHATIGTLTVTANGTRANAYGGGLAGYAVRYGGTVRNCHATVGTLVVEQTSTGAIPEDNDYSLKKMPGREVYGGGLVGRADNGNFEDCSSMIEYTLSVTGNRLLVYGGA